MQKVLDNNGNIFRLEIKIEKLMRLSFLKKMKNFSNDPILYGNSESVT